MTKWGIMYQHFFVENTMWDPRHTSCFESARQLCNESLNKRYITHSKWIVSVSTCCDRKWNYIEYEIVQRAIGPLNLIQSIGYLAISVCCFYLMLTSVVLFTVFECICVVCYPTLRWADDYAQCTWLHFISYQSIIEHMHRILNVRTELKRTHTLTHRHLTLARIKLFLVFRRQEAWRPNRGCIFVILRWLSWK